MDVSLCEEYLPSTHGALGLTTAPHGLGVMVHTYNPSTLEVEAEETRSLGSSLATSEF